MAPPKKSRSQTGKSGRPSGDSLHNDASFQGRDTIPAKDAPHETTLLLSQVLDFLPDATFGIDLEGKVIFWNRAMERLTGINAKDMVGKSNYEYSLPFYGFRRPVLVDLVLNPNMDMEKKYTSLLRQHDCVYAEAVALPLKRHLWIKASPIYDKAGRIVGAIESIRDITDTKLTEGALKSSEAKYRDFFTNVSDYLYLHDLDGRFIETNMASKKETGYTEEEITELTVKDLLPDRHKIRFQNYIQNVLSKGFDEGFLTIRNKFGEERILEYRNSLVRDHEGNAVAVRGSARDITTRIKTQRELKKERNLIASIIQTSPAFYDAIDPEGKTIFMNESMLNALGYRLEDIIGKDYITTFIPEEDHEAFREAMARMIESKKSVVHENRVLTRSGRPLTVQWQGKAVFHENGEADFIFGMGIDVSEYRRTTELISESEKKFRAAFHAIPDPICIIDPASRRIMDVNRAFIRWSGYDRSEAIGRTTTELNIWVNPDDRTWFMNELIEGNNIENVEVKLKDRFGMVREVILSATMVDVEGKSYIFALAHDIPGLKKTEETIKENQRKIETLMGNMPGMAYRSRNDKDWTMDFVSEGSLALTGYSPYELIGNRSLSFNDIVHPLDRERIWQEVQSALETRDRFRLVYRIITKQGEVHWVWEQGVGVFSPKGELLFLEGFITDITERKHAEEELIESEKRYRQLIDQAADGIFLVDGTGQFILVNVKTCEMLGYSEDELLKLNVIDTYPGDMREMGLKRLALFKSGENLRFERPMKRKDGSIFLIEASVTKLPDGRLQAIIHDITKKKQIEAEQYPVRLHPIIKEALKLLRSSIPSNIAITEHIDTSTGPVMADPSQIHQIIMNLCTNAYHAMLEKGGGLTVSFDQVYLDADSTSALPQLKEGTYARLVVSDTGCGMDSETIKRIFDPFFTTKGKDKGTGLGLSTVHGIVSALGGAVVVKSAIGQGSTFETYIPVTSLAEEDSKEPYEDLVPGKGESILLVDDEEAILHFAGAMLEQLGYRVKAVSSSIEALRLFKEDPDAFDLVLTDQTMPGMTGVVLALEILKVRSVPIILMTGYSETISPEEALAKGIEEYIEKPFTRNTLILSIQRCLHERKRRE